MRIAHLSDLHLLDLEGAVPFRLLNKRLTGYANLRLRRGHHHKPAPVRAAARALADHGVDHVVITGDVSNLALEREFDRVRELLERDLGLSADRVSIVPGNHDAYTGGAVRDRRFQRWFGAFMESDLPDLTGPTGFPYVHLRDKAAIIALSTAVARPPFVASGRLGADQLRLLERILEHPEVARRTPVVLQHHPIHNPPSSVKTALEGLIDAEEERRALGALKSGLVLHGHLHRRIQRPLRTEAGMLRAVGATSASLLHEDPDRMAGFNLYDLGDDGEIVALSAQRFDPQTGGFVPTPIPAGI